MSLTTTAAIYAGFLFHDFWPLFASRRHIIEFWYFKLLMLFSRNSENCSYLLLPQGDSVASAKCVKFRL